MNKFSFTTKNLCVNCKLYKSSRSHYKQTTKLWYFLFLCKFLNFSFFTVTFWIEDYYFRYDYFEHLHCSISTNTHGVFFSFFLFTTIKSVVKNVTFSIYIVHKQLMFFNFNASIVKRKIFCAGICLLYTNIYNTNSL